MSKHDLKIVWWTWDYPLGRTKYYWDCPRVMWNFGFLTMDYAL